MKTIVAPALALAEVAGAISRRTGHSSLGTGATASLQRLPSMRLIPVDVELAQLGAELAAGLHLRGADALYVALAHRLGVPLVTWDREQLGTRPGDHSGPDPDRDARILGRSCLIGQYAARNPAVTHLPYALVLSHWPGAFATSV